MPRKLSTADAPALHAIEALATDYPWSQRQYLDSFAIGDFGWGIEHDGQLVGFAIFSHVIDEATLLNLVVAPQWQRHGFARQLLLHGLNELAQRAATRCLLDLPEEWSAEQDEETVVVTDEDGVGALEVTVLEYEDDSPMEVAALAAQLMPEGLAGRDVRIGDFDGLYFEYQDEGDAVREWVVQCGQRTLLVTYSCDIEDAGMDDAIVDEILETLSVKLEE